jgi:transposase InsO family protein
VNEIMAAKHGERRGPKGAPPRRGLKGQRPRRQAERLVRRSALVFLRWLRLRGLSRADAARRLGLLETTVATWEDRWRRDHLEIQARGRTPDRGDRDLRMTVLGLFHFLGPDVGLPTLQAILPDAPRAELVELQRRYRFAHKRRSHCLIHALRWTLPGAVWAMDFAEPPAPIDARYPYVLVVRDLASGCQLEAMPCVEPDAALVISVLEALFAAHGAPLVLKSDNGSAFIAREVAALLDAHDVHHLLSPPGTPSYNGSVEAGIGSLKTRAHHEAARNDRPGEWTCDDVEAARRQANETARPNGHRQPTPLEAWQSRSPIEPSLRVDLTLVRDRYLEEARREKHLAPHALLDRHTEASIHRIALGRALVELGLLQHRRRRVPLRV